MEESQQQQQSFLLTPEEARKEFNYRYEERIAILCGKNDPTAEQMAMAMQEAEEAIKKLT